MSAETKKMTPMQKIMNVIIHRVAERAGENPPVVNVGNVDALYECLSEKGRHWDAMEEIIEGEVETGIPCGRKSVAMQAPDGTWIGWTYEHEGGHSDLGATDWIGSAYDVRCEEEEKVVVRKFKKVG